MPGAAVLDELKNSIEKLGKEVPPSVGFFFFFTPVAWPKRSLSLKGSDTRGYAP